MSFSQDDRRNAIIKNIAKLQKMETDLHKQYEEIMNNKMVIDVGTSSDNSKSVNLPEEGLVVDPESLNTQYSDTFSVAVDGTTLTVKRTDSTGGWDQDLRLNAISQTELDNASQLISNINNASDIRLSQYSELMALNDDIKDSSTEMATVTVAEESLNMSKEKLNILNTQKNNQMRMVQINTYYGKRYDAHIGVMKVFLLMCVIILIIAILSKKNIIPSNLTNALCAVVFVIFACILIRKMYDLSKRSNMNYDEYEWKYDGETSGSDAYPDSSMNDTANSATLANVGFGCVGADCCGDGLTYDSSLNICIEGFNGINSWSQSPAKPHDTKENVYAGV